MITPAALIVGNRNDPHVTAVTDRISARTRSTVLVLDAQTLSNSAFFVDPAAGATVEPPGGPAVDLRSPMRGWLRRVAPDGWDHGVAIGSQDAAVRTAWLTLLSAVVRTGSVEWLTAPAPAAIAENKVVQYAAAATIGIPAPRTVVTSDPVVVKTALGDRVVLKPLGPGETRDDRSAKAVFAQTMSSDDPRLALLAGAPFIAQQHIDAARHMRVVTVGDRAWSAVIDVGPDLPLDWRQAASAHRSFRPATETTVSDAALRLAHHLDVGYTSQDWITDTAGTDYFLDLNPGGQWLFLPCADEVSEALAAWLSEPVR